jgi:hypothetical protein
VDDRSAVSQLDRRSLITGLCAAGSLACLGCSRLAFAGDVKEAASHKFDAPSEYTFAQVFKHAYGDAFIPTMQVLKEQVGLETIQAAASESARRQIGAMAKMAPSTGLADWVRPLKKPNRLWSHALTFEVVEDTENTFEVRIKECLWAKTFRDADAADLGYAYVCHADFAMAQAFNPKLHLTRDTTLMQGDSYCNHRWEFKA